MRPVAIIRGKASCWKKLWSTPMTSCLRSCPLLGLLVIVAGVGAPMLAFARYARPDIEKVPVERLVKNLEERIKQKPDDAEAVFNLARVHAMAYALKSDTAEVRKGEENKGAWFGYEPAHVPFANEPTKDEARLKAAKEH